MNLIYMKIVHRFHSTMDAMLSSLNGSKDYHNILLAPYHRSVHSLQFTTHSSN